MFDGIKEKLNAFLYRSSTDWGERIGLATSQIVMNRVQIQDEKLLSLEVKEYVGISSAGVEITGFSTLPHGAVSFRDLEVGYFFLHPKGEKRTAILFYSEDGLMTLSDEQQKAISDYALGEIEEAQVLLVVDGTVISSPSGMDFEHTQKVVNKIKSLAY